MEDLREKEVLLSETIRYDWGVYDMSFFTPIPLIRRKHILNRLRKCGATSKETAKTLSDAGVINPNALKAITEKLIKKHKCGNVMFPAIIHGVVIIIGEVPMYLSVTQESRLLGPNPAGLIGSIDMQNIKDFIAQPLDLSAQVLNNQRVGFYGRKAQ